MSLPALIAPENMRHPELYELRENDISQIKVSQDRSDAEVHLVDEDNNLIRVNLSNKDKSPIKFDIGGLYLGVIYDEDSNRYTFGEFEYYHEDVDGWIHFEGDAGLFSFLCTQVKIHKHG